MEYHYISPNYAHWDWNSRSYGYRRRYYETTYSRNSPYEQMKRDRHRIAVAIPGIGMDSYGLFNEPPKVCRDDPHIPLKLMVDKTTGKDAWWCRECGTFWPLEDENVNSDGNGNGNDKDKPTPPKESKSISKIKQKDSSALKSFIIAQEEPKDRRKSKFGQIQDLSEGLSEDEISYISGLYGNVVSRSEY